MQNYIEIIKNAILFFPIVAFFITIPYILIQYHKFGSVYYYRSIIVYSFVLYLIVAYFLIIFPLPSKEEVALLTTPRWQLQPFSFLLDIINKSPLEISDITTYLPTLKSQAFRQAFFNVLLCIPFGIYLHYYFKNSLKKTVVLTFCLSLFFELTQLTGLYFIYPRNYRLFDVDDLILNTTGGLIGYFLGSIILRFLPNRNKIDEIALNRGMKVSFIKRCVAFILDLILFHLLFTITNVFVQRFISSNLTSRIVYVLLLIYYFVIRPTAKNSQTYGQQFLNLKLICITSTANPKWHQILLYYWYFYFFSFGSITFISIAIMHLKEKEIISTNRYTVILLSFVILYLLCALLYFIKRILNKELIFEKLSGLKLKSTIKKTF